MELIHTHPFYEIAGILVLAASLGALGLKLRQPLIIVFLAVGILSGPSALGIIRSYEQIELFAEIGIALLLFIVGLRLDLHLIRTIGPVALATGIGQLAFTSVLGFGIGRLFGMPNLTAAYVAVALTFSSTIIVVKLLSDKKEIDSLHGRIAVGFLIVQDIAAILALVGLTTFGGRAADGAFTPGAAWAIAGKAAALLGGVALLMRFAVNPALQRLARSQELLAVSAIAWAVLLSAVSDALGFSKEVGAFLAGVSLASSEYRDAIGGRLSSLRDFLLLFFFIGLGSRLDWSTVGAQIGASAAFSAFVLIGNPLIVLAIMGFMGYRRRTAFLAGLTVAQISEFSLILVALGVSVGHISREVVGLVTLVGVLTISLSTYMILYSGGLYRALSRPLRLFERRAPFRESETGPSTGGDGVDALVIGLGRYGSRVAEQMLLRGKKLVGVDFDPDQLKLWRERGMCVFYGDATDPELYEQLPLARTVWVVISMRAPVVNMAVLRILRQRQFGGHVALSAADEMDMELYRRHGASAVLCPFRDAAEEAVNILCRAPQILPGLPGWPLTFDEIRLPVGTQHVGRLLREVPIRATTGATVVAVVRGGRVHYAPGAEFRLYPGDHMVVAGGPDEVGRAVELLADVREVADASAEDGFAMVELAVAGDSAMVGRTLGELAFRQRFGATVLGILRRGEYMLAPSAADRLAPADRLLVFGSAESLAALSKE